MLKRIHILLVTADEEWRAKLYTQLAHQNFDQVDQAADAITALSLCYEAQPDLVVLEARLPDAEGLTLCRMIQVSSPTTKVVLVTNDASLQMTALQVGATGCISRDFPLSKWSTLLNYVNRGGAIFSQATIDEVLVQSSSVKTETHTVSVGTLTVDLSRRRVTLAGRGLHLTPREFALLACLAQNVGQAVTFDQLLNEAWGYDEEMGTEAQVRLYITRLRRKLGDDSQTFDFIISERGIGYRLCSQEEWDQKTNPDRLNIFHTARLLEGISGGYSGSSLPLNSLITV
jgi:two-component system KDP operon response regulator KdpE